MRIAYLTLLVLLACACSFASPIVYSGTLTSGIAVTGSIDQDDHANNNPVGAIYFQFWTTAGWLVDIDGDRSTGKYNMLFWVYEGLLGDTDDFNPGFSRSDRHFVAFGDDEDSPKIGGPHGDPHVYFVAPSTGWYTVAVGNFQSAAQKQTFGFQLLETTAPAADPVPEPSSLLMLTGGVLFAVGVRSSRRHAVR